MLWIFESHHLHSSDRKIHTTRELLILVTPIVTCHLFKENDISGLIKRIKIGHSIGVYHRREIEWNERKMIK